MKIEYNSVFFSQFFKASPASRGVICQRGEGVKLQKEAYLFNVPPISIRDETEWGALVNAGDNVLINTDSKRTLSTFKEQDHFIIISFDLPLYSKGLISPKILEFFL